MYNRNYGGFDSPSIALRAGLNPFGIANVGEKPKNKVNQTNN